MNKTKLERFILKYNLNGNADSVKWVIKKNKLFTSFVTSDRSVVGNVSADNFNFESTAFGVYSTKQLQRLLNVLGDNIDLSLLKIDKKAISLKISDPIASVNFTLADLLTIPEPPHLTAELLSQPDAIIDIDTKFIDTFIKGKNALPDAATFTILDSDSNNDLKIVIGYSSTINTNKVTIPVKVKDKLFPDSLSFNAEIFKEILLANKECTSAVLKISNVKGGLAHIGFEVDDYFSEYYLSAMQSN
jgi:hypothetical protein